MLRYGYDRKFTSGVIAASGTLAQIIPPSLVLIIMADQLGKSVGDMYKGAFLPAFILVGLYVIYVIFLAIFKPSQVPALPPEARIYREPNGGGGYASLVVLMGVSAFVAVLLARHMAELHTWWLGTEVTAVATDEKVVVAMCGGAFVAFLIALINKVTRLGLLSRLAERVTFVLIPPLLLIFLVLGTIFLGIATPTEGGAMGALGAFIMSMVRGRLSMALLKQALNTTTKLSCFVVFILIGSTVFSLVFQGVDGPRWVEHLLGGLPGGPLGFLIVVNLMIFFLAFFLDFFELSFIVVPLLAPVAQKLGIDLIWFGVLLAVNMQTSFMHPPFGLALFYLRSVAPHDDYRDRVTGTTVAGVRTSQIYWGSVPFIVIQLAMVVIVMTFPGLVMHYKDGESKIDPSSVKIEVQGGGAGFNPYDNGEPPAMPTAP